MKVPGYKTGGMREKYIITKRSGNPVDPDAKYWVLRYDVDPHALAGTLAYARSVLVDNPRLTKDMLEHLYRFAVEHDLLSSWAQVAHSLLYQLEPNQGREALRRRLQVIELQQEETAAADKEKP